MHLLIALVRPQIEMGITQDTLFFLALFEELRSTGARIFFPWLLSMWRPQKVYLGPLGGKVLVM